MNDAAGIEHRFNIDGYDQIVSEIAKGCYLLSAERTSQLTNEDSYSLPNWLHEL